MRVPDPGVFALLFIQYYPRFTRFEAKQFLLEAVRFMAGCCPTCVIDNTSVMVVAGAGDDAVFAPEMVALARTLGFAFRAHPVNNPIARGGRKTFCLGRRQFPGRPDVRDFADLNEQALAWCENGGQCQAEACLGMAPSAAYASRSPACSRCRRCCRRSIRWSSGWSICRVSCRLRPIAIRCPNAGWARR
jgi:hypothetical protein